LQSVLHRLPATIQAVYVDYTAVIPMGYDIHITRALHWTDSESVPITLDEWKEYVASDAEMRMDGFAEAATTAGETIRYENEGLAVWLPAASHDRGGGWMDYRNGRIVVKYPDDEMLAKMKRIAAVFNASIMGDEGELY
jgi:hypothetical protein